MVINKGLLLRMEKALMFEGEGAEFSFCNLIVLHGMNRVYMGIDHVNREFSLE
jgi:hypothetical protein